MNDISWLWIAFELIVPSALGVLVAYPVWLKGEPILGNLFATVVIFAAAIGLVFRERLALDDLMQRCLDRGIVCWPSPSPFARYAIYAFIALVEVIGVFTLSLRVEARLRRRGYAPEWQR